jgi:hypothetical protein
MDQHTWDRIKGMTRKEGLACADLIEERGRAQQRSEQSLRKFAELFDKYPASETVGDVIAALQGNKTDEAIAETTLKDRQRIAQLESKLIELVYMNKSERTIPV